MHRHLWQKSSVNRWLDTRNTVEPWSTRWKPHTHRLSLMHLDGDINYISDFDWKEAATRSIFTVRGLFRAFSAGAYAGFHFGRGWMASAGARAYNGGLGAVPPARSGGRAPGGGSGGRSHPEAESYLLWDALKVANFVVHFWKSVVAQIHNTKTKHKIRQFCCHSRVVVENVKFEKCNF